jgi:hypothetical protein
MLDFSMGEKRRSIPRENRPHEEGHSGPEKRQPVPRAHMDQTPAASVARVRDANPHETDVNPHSGDANPHETDVNPHISEMPIHMRRMSIHTRRTSIHI